MKKILGIIPCRSNSKEIPNKNIKKINGKPMILYVIKSSLKSKIFEKIVISTDSKKYINIIKKLLSKSDLNKVIFHKRSKISATDNAKTEIVLLEVLKKYNVFDDCYLIQATSPLTNYIDFKKSYKLFVKKDYDSLLSVTNFSKFVWKKNKEYYTPINYNLFKRPMRQNSKKQYYENGAFYIFKVKKFLKIKNRLFGRIGLYEMPETRSIEIDTMNDLKILKYKIKKSF